MSDTNTSLNFDSAVVNCLKNQSISESLDSPNPIGELGLHLTLTITSDAILVWNGITQTEITPKDETSRFLLSLLHSQRRKYEEQKRSRPKPVFKPKKKEKKNTTTLSAKPQQSANRNFVPSNYRSLGSGKGKELMTRKPPKTQKRKVLSLDSIL